MRRKARTQKIMNNTEFEWKIQYEFRDKGLLNKALTHSSYCREEGLDPTESNERLEFLGDAYLDAIAGTELYRRMKNVGEGRLTRTRAAVVCEHSLAKVGGRIGIGAYFNMGNGEDHCGGRHRESIVADGVEAVIGAIFLDGGYDAASDFVLREFSDIIEDAMKGRLFTDFKTQVQEILQKDGTAPDICYVLDREEGPDHDKTFYVHLTCDGRTLGSGSGKSKKEAEQNAARATLNGGLI